MKKIKNVLILFLAASSLVFAQKKINKENLQSNFSKSENKKIYYSNLVKNISTTFNKDIKSNFSKWNKALRDAQSILLKNNDVKNGLEKIFALKIDKHLKLQRTALEIAYTLFTTEFTEEIQRINRITKDKISFVISSHYLLKNNFTADFILGNVKKHFNNYKKNDIIESLLNDLTKKNDPLKLPNITELLTHQFQKGETIFYSFHRKNRNYPGITVIKKPNGEFVKNSNGTIFYIRQLALSLSNLPGYIPNGNTPEGIYSIVGKYISPTKTIGPTPNVLVRSPFEVSTKIFFHNKNKNKKWSLEDYQNLLPDSWKGYSPIYESFYAGRTGRKVIIIHGSTDELKYFRDKPYYPHTPTLGCMSSIEIWNKKGKIIRSDQADLINAFLSTKESKGFLVVVNIDDKEKPVEIDEIKKYIVNP